MPLLEQYEEEFEGDQVRYGRSLRALGVYDEDFIAEFAKVADAMEAAGIRTAVERRTMTSRTPKQAIINVLMGKGGGGSAHIVDKNGKSHAIDINELQKGSDTAFVQGRPSKLFIKTIESATGAGKHFLRGDDVKEGDYGHLEEDRGAPGGKSDLGPTMALLRKHGIKKSEIKALKGTKRTLAEANAEWDKLAKAGAARKTTNAAAAGAVFPNENMGDKDARP